MKRDNICDNSNRDWICNCRITNCAKHRVPAPFQHQTLLSSRCSERQGWNLLGRTEVANLFKTALFSIGNYFSGQSVSHPSGPNTWCSVFGDELQSSSNSSVKLSEVMWSIVECLTWFMWSDFILKRSGVTAKFVVQKVARTLGLTLYWRYLIVLWLLHFGVPCTVVPLTCFVMCGCVCVCRCFGNMCSCIYCVLYCLYCVFVLFRLCIFILICFVCI